MKSERKQLHSWFILFDIFITGIAYIFSWYVVIILRAGGDNLGVLPWWFYFSAMVVIIPVAIATNAFFSLYSSSRTEGFLRETYRIIESNIIIFLLINTILLLGNKNIYLYNFSRLLVLVFVAANALFELILRNIIRIILSSLRKRNFNLRHILLVGYSDAAFKFIDRVNRNPGWGYIIHGIVDDTHDIGVSYRNVSIIDKISNLQKIISDNTFDEIAITLSLSEYNKLRNVVDICEKTGVHTKFVPDYGTVIPTMPVADDLDGLPVINIRAVPLQGLFNRFIKRTIDIIGSIVGILIFSPIMIIISIAIKLTSKGAIIFKQKRVGLHNKLFVMYKFRSMIEQTDEEEKTKWTTENDDRVTKVGRIIRSTSLDEVPQFFNVLKGDMSLVGPRPEREQFVEKFKETIPRYMIKHQVRPGITGWAQVNGLRGDTAIDRRIQYDLWYIENWSMILDIKILILTIFRGFINKNAY